MAVRFVGQNGLICLMKLNRHDALELFEEFSSLTDDNTVDSATHACFLI